MALACGTTLTGTLTAGQLQCCCRGKTRAARTHTKKRPGALAMPTWAQASITNAAAD